MSLIVGLQHGLCVGLEVGVDATCGIAGVTRDAGSLKYTPETAAEWTAFLKHIGSTLAAPQHLWRLQEAGGNPADTIGSKTLTATTAAAAPVYRRSIPGWARWAIGGPGSAVNCNLGNATMVNTASSSFLVFFYARSATATVLRNYCTYGSVLVQQPASSKTRLRLGGGVTDSTGDLAGATVRPYLVAFDITNSTCKLYSDAEKQSVAFAASAGSSLTFFGAGTGDATIADFLLAAAWDGAPGEITDGEAKKLITGLGYTPPWS